MTVFHASAMLAWDNDYWPCIMTAKIDSWALWLAPVDRVMQHHLSVHFTMHLVCRLSHFEHPILTSKVVHLTVFRIHCKQPCIPLSTNTLTNKIMSLFLLRHVHSAAQRVSLIVILGCLSVGHSTTYSLPQLIDHNLSSHVCKPFWIP